MPSKKDKGDKKRKRQSVNDNDTDAGSWDVDKQLELEIEAAQSARSSKRQKLETPSRSVKQGVEVRVGRSAREPSTRSEPNTAAMHRNGRNAREQASGAHEIQPTATSVRSTRRRNVEEEDDLRTEKPSAVFKPTKGRDWTLSIAIPGSFLHNAKDKQLKSAVCGQIARAAAVFCVDEIVVYDDDPCHLNGRPVDHRKKAELLEKIDPKDQHLQDPDMFLYTLLMYLECPPHFRKTLFQFDPRLQHQGIFPSLDMPHHTKPHEWSQFREGVSLDPETAASDPNLSREAIAELKKLKKSKAKPTFTYVDCGFDAPLKVPVEIPGGMRVTLRFPDAEPPSSWPHLSPGDLAYLEETVETPHIDQPRLEGYYWGYNVRKVSSFSAVLQDCDYEDGYSYVIGTSERGVPLSSIFPAPNEPEDNDKLPKKFDHLLVVFGGVSGLEPIIAGDPTLKKKGMTKENAHTAFDAWVNVLPGQGSRTIRMEEAVWISLMGLRPYIESFL